MVEIRIERVYDGHGRHATYVNLKQTEPGVVWCSEDFYPIGSSRAIKGEKRQITPAQANEIFRELKQTATPYIRYSEGQLLNPMK